MSAVTFALMQRVTLIDSIFQAMQTANAYENGKKLVEELIKTDPNDFLSHYIAAFYYNAFNEHESNQLSLKKMIQLANNNDMAQQRAILLIKGKLFHGRGYASAALQIFEKAINTKVQKDDAIFFIDDILLGDAAQIILKYNKLNDFVSGNHDECYNGSFIDNPYGSIKHYICQQQSADFILNKIISNNQLININGKEQINILMLFLRLRPQSDLINGYLKHIFSEWFVDKPDYNLILNDNKYKEFIKYLFVIYPKYDIIISDFIKITLYNSLNKFKLLFNLQHSFIYNIIFNAVQNEYNIALPDVVLNKISFYVTDILNEDDIIEVNGLYNNKNIVSKFNDNYYCDILSYSLSSYFIIINFDVHGNMSASILQKPLCSALLIVYKDSNFNNDVISADKVSSELYDIKYQIKGKISYYIPNDIKKKMINANSFKILFQYGIFPDGGYLPAEIYSYNKTRKKSSKIFAKLCLMPNGTI